MTTRDTKDRGCERCGRSALELAHLPNGTDRLREREFPLTGKWMVCKPCAELLEMWERTNS